MALNKEKILAWVSKNLDKVVFALQGVLLLLAVFLIWTESNAPDLEVAQVQSKDPLPQINPADTKIPGAGNASYAKVMGLVQPRPPLDASEYLSIIQINAFDPKTVKNSDQLTKEADKGLAEAKALFEQGKLEEARVRARKVLESMPGHKGSQELVKKIDETAKSAATPAATPPGPAGPK